MRTIDVLADPLFEDELRLIFDITSCRRSRSFQNKQNKNSRWDYGEDTNTMSTLFTRKTKENVRVLFFFSKKKIGFQIQALVKNCTHKKRRCVRVLASAECTQFLGVWWCAALGVPATNDRSGLLSACI